MFPTGRLGYSEANAGRNEWGCLVVTVSRRVEVTPEQVFAVIEDGWYFASWVVGAAHIRTVEPNWPAVGSRIHHSVGPWPVSINDTTVVRAVERNSMIELEARAWPIGGATVRITLEPAGPTGTQITMTEEVTSGPAKVLPHAAQTALLKPRNDESLRRLADIAVGRAARPQR